MTKRVRTGVSFLRAVALTIVSLAPAAAGANSLTPVPVQTTVAADGTIQFQGEFTWDNDVALLPFFLGEGEFEFTANTTSYAAFGFDPLLSLFYIPGEDVAADPLDLSDLVLYQYQDKDDETVFYPAWFDDIDLNPDNDLLDSSFPLLTLTDPGQYVLALTQALNYPKDAFGFESDDVSFKCTVSVEGGPCEPVFGGRGAFFAGSMKITPVGTTPVPEPGTLSLLALGSLATAFVRRRRRAAVTTRP